MIKGATLSGDKVIFNEIICSNLDYYRSWSHFKKGGGHFRRREGGWFSFQREGDL